MRKWTAQIIGCLALVLAPITTRADTDEKRNNHGDDARITRGSDWKARVEIGGRIGFDVATFVGPGTNERYVNYSPSLGISVAVDIGFRLSEYIAVQTDLMLTVKGPHSATNGMDFGTYSMTYFELPLLVRGTLPTTGRIEYYATLGPALSFLLDADIDLNDGSHFDLDSYELLDIGVLMGAGAALELGEKGALTLDLRYNRGLLNFSQSAASEEEELMHQAFYFTVGYRTNLDTLLGGSSGASTSPLEPPPSPEVQPADAPAPAPPSDA